MTWRGRVSLGRDYSQSILSDMILEDIVVIFHRGDLCMELPQGDGGEFSFWAAFALSCNKSEGSCKSIARELKIAKKKHCDSDGALCDHRGLLVFSFSTGGIWVIIKRKFISKLKKAEWNAALGYITMSSMCKMGDL